MGCSAENFPNKQTTNRGNFLITVSYAAAIDSNRIPCILFNDTTSVRYKSIQGTPNDRYGSFETIVYYGTISLDRVRRPLSRRVRTRIYSRSFGIRGIRNAINTFFCSRGMQIPISVVASFRCEV